MSYKDTVKQIHDLNWKGLTSSDLQDLMVLSKVFAKEFSDSLQSALIMYPTHAGLQEMAAEELQTNNLQFQDYARKGDHWEFLDHFIRKYHVHDRFHYSTEVDCLNYADKVACLDPEVIAMSIFSREQELPSIFERILEAPDWNAPGLDAYRYYLEQHIHLDSQEGGHADMVADFPIDERVDQFYTARLDAYRSIPVLFH